MSLGKRLSSQRHDSEEDDRLDAVSPKRTRKNSLHNGTEPQQEDSEAVATDAQDSEAEDEDEQDQIDSETDRIEEEQRLADANQGSALAGIIHTIDLKNFMCHANFHVDFQAGLNFVMGRNGSGKSSILTALMVALGGKTSSTNRGSSLKDLVKKGASTATITVVVKNEGSDAFRPGTYGNSITIERKIHVEGAGTWKLKDATGRTVSTAKSELEAFCDHTNIQPDNPIHILTQDTARQFLGSSDPAEIYKFFLEGTQLSQLVREYNLIEGHIRSMKTALALKSTSILQLEKLAQHALQQWQKVRETRGYQDKIDALDQEFVWVQVHNARRELESAIEATEKLRRKLDGYNKRLEGNNAKLEELSASIIRLEQESNDFEGEMTPSRERRATLESQKKEIGTSYKAIQAQEREINDQIRELNSQIENYEDQIRDETTKLAGDRQAQRQQLEDSRQRLVQQKSDLQMEHAEREEELGDIENKLREALSNEENEENRLSHLRNQYDSNAASLRTLVDTSSNRITAFGGARVPALMRAIQNERGWIKRPVGPLGTHLKLRDMRWRRVVESVLGNLLNAFFVTNNEDRKRLKRLMDKADHQVMIVSGKETLFDYSNGEPDASILTILRVLECDDEHVLRQLIISAHIERAALVPQRSDGDRLMRSEPRNVQHCYSADLFSIMGGRSGSLSSSMGETKGAPRLSQNLADDIRKVQEEQADLDVQLRRCNSDLAELKKSKIALEREKHACKQALGRLRRDLEVNKSNIIGIEEEMQDSAPGNISGLEDAMRETEEQKEEILRQFGEIQEKKTGLRAQFQPIDAELKELDDSVMDYNRRMTELQENMQTAVADRIREQTSLAHYRTRKDACAIEVARCEAKEVDLENDHKHLEEQATQYCPEVATERTLDEITAEKKELELLKKKATNAAGITLEQASADLQKRQKALADAGEEVQTMREAETRLDAALRDRYAKWKFFRRCIATRAKSNFARNLSKRGFTGGLVFNHKLEKLSLHMQKEDSRLPHTQSSSNSKSMSGGERSFATMCLLLSLWQAMSSPIRCLDEFDIFMDQVNRGVSLNMIIDETKATPNVQYLLITPQDMPPSVRKRAAESDTISLLEIDAPERTGTGALATA